jgi:putative PIN family toxin of toxin-antitoxin system
MLKVVLDTNVILRTISRRSEFSVILDQLYQGVFEIWVTNEILLEYEEKISSIFSKETADLILGVFTLLPNVKRVEIHFNLGLIETDMDDNKFVDCAFAGNVHYLVTNDRHFNRLKTLEFPTINVITLEEFRELV